MEKVTTPEFRVSFPSVFTPRPGMNGGKAKYSVMMLFPKSSDLSAVKRLLASAVKEEWGDKIPPNLTNPIKDGDTDMMNDGTLRCEKYPEMKGHWIINAASIKKPGVVDGNLNAIIEEGEFYGGCYARATLHAYTYKPTKDKPQSKIGVGFGLNNIQKLRDGDSFSGRSRAEEDFEVVESKGTGNAVNQVSEESFDNMFS